MHYNLFRLVQIMYSPIVRWWSPTVYRPSNCSDAISTFNTNLSESSESYACPSGPPTGDPALPNVTSGRLHLPLHAITDS
jgi:hypothetical protein